MHIGTSRRANGEHKASLPCHNAVLIWSCLYSWRLSHQRDGLPAYRSCIETVGSNRCGLGIYSSSKRLITSEKRKVFNHPSLNRPPVLWKVQARQKTTFQNSKKCICGIALAWRVCFGRQAAPVAERAFSALEDYACLQKIYASIHTTCGFQARWGHGLLRPMTRRQPCWSL